MNTLFEKHIKSIRINPNIFKYWGFWELNILVLETKSNMTSKCGTNYFIIICHCKLEECKTDRDRYDPSRLPRISEETRSNNSGRYTFIPHRPCVYMSHIPWSHIASLIYLGEAMELMFLRTNFFFFFINFH